MNNTQYLINDKLIEVPDSDDPIVTTMMSVTEKEINLIKAMRSVVPQTNEYEVHVITKNYPGGYVVNEYHDTFLTNDRLFNDIETDIDINIIIYEFYNVTIHNGQVHYAPHSYMRNKMTHETYIVIGD